MENSEEVRIEKFLEETKKHKLNEIVRQLQTNELAGITENLFQKIIESQKNYEIAIGRTCFSRERCCARVSKTREFEWRVAGGREAA